MLYAALFILFLTLPTGISAFNPQSVASVSSLLHWDGVSTKSSKTNHSNENGNSISDNNTRQQRLIGSVGRRLSPVSMVADGTGLRRVLLPPSLVTATAAATATATASTPSSSSLQAVFAQSLGGVMFAGAVLLYTPILLKLWREKNGEGMSFQTWVFNTMGFTGNE